MVTISTTKRLQGVDIIPYSDIRCLSTDTKPTEDIPNGSTCIEMDTGKGFLFDADNAEWHELPAGGSVVIDPARGVAF